MSFNEKILLDRFQRKLAKAREKYGDKKITIKIEDEKWLQILVCGEKVDDIAITKRLANLILNASDKINLKK